MANGSGVFSAVEIAAAPYKFGLVRWEISNLPDKWFHMFIGIFPGNGKSTGDRRAQLIEYFRLGEEIRAVEGEAERLSAGGIPITPNGQFTLPPQRLDDLQSRRRGMGSSVQKSLESEISSVLSSEGLSSRIGLIFPPVDLVFSDTPRLLVVSPRHTIQLQKTILLRPDMALEDMESLEDKLFQEQNLAALVDSIGGLATYPAMISDKSGLLSAAQKGAHEWLHHFWFFCPLGRSYFGQTSEMRTLNETAADLAGDEIGAMVYEAVTGDTLEPERRPPIVGGEEEDFNFREEMRQTRLRAEELLAEGKIERAESYMEARRLRFVENGYNIRKLNQAYFAFRGHYGSSPESISPIQGQLELLRANASSVGDFIRTVGGFGSYREFEEHIANLLPSPELATVSD